MLFKSLIHDVRGELGSISRRRFEARLGSRSHRTVPDGGAAAAGDGGGGDAVGRSCWAGLPPELLREVLIRIEADGAAWPLRKDVVACAGVCRFWRRTVMQIVSVPQLSGRLTFPISVKQPGPRDFLVQCFIKRNRSAQTYHLYLGLTQALTGAGKFLLAAKKCRRATCTDYIISLHSRDISKSSYTNIGKLRSNFLGTKFVVYDNAPPSDGSGILGSRTSHALSTKKFSPRAPAGNYPICHIAYELNMLGSRGPRRMHCAMDSIPASSIEPGGVPTQTDFPLSYLDSFAAIPFFPYKSYFPEEFSCEALTGSNETTLILKNKSPRWHEQLQCWCLNFRGRVTVASVKNFQLVASVENGDPSQEHEDVILQFGKVGKDLFTMDYRYPLSAFQAFAICLSSFDTKIACE